MPAYHPSYGPLISGPVYNWMVITNNIGRNLTHLRNVRGLSQQEIEEGTKIAQTTISKIERNFLGKQYYLDNVLRIAEFFKVHPVAMMFGERDHLITPQAFAVARAFDQADRDTRATIMNMLNLPPNAD
jgi:transcriptional regulator with XRE-family HTH domain